MKIEALETTEGFQIYWEDGNDYGWVAHPAARTKAGAYISCVKTLLKKLRDIEKLTRY